MKTLFKLSDLRQSPLLWLVIFCCLNFGYSQELTVSSTGGQILKDGNPITLRGVNFGNWLLWEGYMLNLDQDGIKTHTQIRNGIKGLLNNNESKTQAFETDWRNTYITNDDFAEAKQLGFNVIRIPFHYNMFWNTSNGTLKNDGFQWLDKAVNWAQNNNIYVIFCMHAAPGYQNPDHHSDNPGTTVDFWNTNNSNVNIASSVWKHIANRYKNYPGNKWIAGYDLLNEPVLETNKYRLIYGYKQLTAAIRSEDPNHLIFAEGNYYGSDFYDMLERWDNNLVFSNHYYGAQGESNPNPQLQTIMSQASQLNIPIFVGEFGENTLDWVNSARTDYDTQNLNWAFWAWKRHETTRSIYSFDGFYGWWRITQYLKFGENRPNLQETETWLAELLNKIKLSNSHLQQPLKDRLLPPQPIGRYIWLRNSNKYVSSNNGSGPVTCDRSSRGQWERFRVVSAGDRKIALKGNNRRYINSQNGNSAMTCTSTSVQGWESFEWIDVYGNVALKGFNGKYVSSEGGSSNGMNSNRDTASGWEVFEWQDLSKNGELSGTFESNENSALVDVYPNPASDRLYINLAEDQSPILRLEVYNLQGQRISESQSAKEGIDIQELAQGTYILSIELQDGQQLHQRFLKE
ncbi:cellulase family glycosylhydrolase [Nonlabens xiamenensis]|uniref:cellulase family glycosylhydrolase n=1 Tax=Nonlabens xiamenensis TaxID=2341043 RepID=UPI000F6101BD|nr:cellulase family glycosylhydrolase [Nonlabens xiamenensis]